jgi:hypothetical protein
MKNKTKILYVIEKSPGSLKNPIMIDRIHNNIKENNPVTVYIQNDGIRWLSDENWRQLFIPDENFVYYANVQDAKDYCVPFQDGVIFSNPKILFQLINWADKVFFIN